ncbi:aminotransferase class I/II-fold pyridoxal phosphate-dependent enzyme [Draconibacterium orientale]|uniref:aminotransferase class I/II-fold pyridoxal phosphate-dependent enzyme n=1 Tax=Draconibacterium orientale TaxID=1168034 RepID=UPI002A0A6FD1|nr:aminotransferase class I/II-fold pyridoxal phosphate-dependent enzyme [Draconibacterium orientale]
MIQGHGDDIYNFKNIQINFSSNVNSQGMSPGLQNHLKSCISCLDAYPEPSAEHLARCIEQQNNLAPQSVLVTNGAVEAFYLLASLFQKKNSLIYIPSFSEYEDACKMYDHNIEFCRNTHFSEENKTPFDVVWICNPNNPDGRIFDKDILRDQIQKNPDTLFVLDEAYVEFIGKNISLENEVQNTQNLVVVRSLTKRFSIPGLRLGYLVCMPKLMSKLKEKLMPWRINSLAVEAGLYCCSSEYKDNFCVAKILKESQRFQAEIAQIPGFEVVSSETSFFLVKAPKKAAEIKMQLARKYGMLIRDASNFRGLSEFHFRLATQTAEKNNSLIKVLKSWSC